MAVITTPKLSLVNQLRADFPQFNFKHADVFKWSPSDNTIYFKTSASLGAKAQILHELGHALLNHYDFEFDIELVKKEAEAWNYAKKRLAKRYKVDLTQDKIDDTLETYREWLYQRSLCPNCQQTGLQTKTNTYSCLNCGCLWRVNDARDCRLRRQRI